MKPQVIYPVDIPFKRAPILAQSSIGRPFTRWVPIGMPQLGQYEQILETVFFLYASAADAAEGKKFGGTGFIIGRRTKGWPDKYHHMFAVTNWHVACRDGFSVIRLNTTDGKTEILDLGPEDWHFIPGKNDIAVTPIGLKDHHQALALDENFFDKFPDDKDRLGPGDDVFMIGRFVDYDGVQRNQPSVRFGHISMISVPIKQPTGYMGQSIVLDMHSRTGYSGSPVFVYRTAGSVFAPKGKIFTGGHYLGLLGIHWGQFPELWEIEADDRQRRGDEASLITEGKYVRGLSGMTCVIPSAAIEEILQTPAIRAIMEQTEMAIKKRDGAASAPVAESTKSETPENPNHKEDFTALLDAAARKPK